MQYGLSLNMSGVGGQVLYQVCVGRGRVGDSTGSRELGPVPGVGGRGEG